MPRYYFNTRIGKEFILDPEGEELRDPDQAWEVARTTIRQLLKTEGSQATVLNAILEVTDDDGEIVLEFPFPGALLAPPDEPATRHWCAGMAIDAGRIASAGLRHAGSSLRAMQD